MNVDALCKTTAFAGQVKLSATGVADETIATRAMTPWPSPKRILNNNTGTMAASVGRSLERLAFAEKLQQRQPMTGSRILFRKTRTIPVIDANETFALHWKASLVTNGASV